MVTSLEVIMLVTSFVIKGIQLAVPVLETPQHVLNL